MKFINWLMILAMICFFVGCTYGKTSEKELPKWTLISKDRWELYKFTDGNVSCFSTARQETLSCVRTE